MNFGSALILPVPVQPPSTSEYLTTGELVPEVVKSEFSLFQMMELRTWGEELYTAIPPPWSAPVFSHTVTFVSTGFELFVI